MNIPTTDLELVSHPQSPALILHRNILGLWFDSTASGAVIRSLLSRYRGRIIGGAPIAGPDSMYVVQFPDPGVEYDSLMALVGRLKAEPGVRAVMPLPLHDPPRLRDRSAEVATDTARPQIPATYGLPRGDGVKTFALPTDSLAKGDRQFIEIRFQDTVSGPAFRVFLNDYQATVTGGSRVAGAYILRFPDPGVAYQNVTDFILRLRADPRVARAAGIEYSPPFSPPQGFREAQLSGPASRRDPPVPGSMNLPTDTSLAIMGEGFRPSKYYRNVFAVQFEDSTSGSTIRHFLALFGATIIGGLTLDEDEAPYYIIVVPDPGPTWNLIKARRGGMERARGVQSLLQMQIRGVIDIRGRTEGVPAVGTVPPSSRSLPNELQVLTSPPDSIPAWVYADSNLVKNDTLVSGIYPQGILLVWFLDRSTPGERRRLIHGIDAEVVGGKAAVATRGGMTTPLYVIRLNGDRSTAAMRAALRVLLASRSVANAGFDFQISDQ